MGEESSLVTRRTTHHCLSLLHPQCYRQFSLVVWLRDVSSAYPPAGQSRQTEWSWHSSLRPSRGFVRCLTHLSVQWRPFYSKRSWKDSHLKCARPSVIKLLCCGTTYSRQSRLQKPSLCLRINLKLFFLPKPIARTVQTLPGEITSPPELLYSIFVQHVSGSPAPFLTGAGTAAGSKTRCMHGPNLDPAASTHCHLYPPHVSPLSLNSLLSSV